jgi:phosphatidate cytidylyltransferase
VNAASGSGRHSRASRRGAILTWSDGCWWQFRRRCWRSYSWISACACLVELYPLLEDWRPLSFIGFVGAIGMCMAAHYGDLHDVIGVAVAMLPLMFLGIVARGDSQGATLSIAGTLLGLFWIGFAFAHAILLRQLPHGKDLMIDVLVGTFVSDTIAYFGGRAFGRHPLAPTISPKKTFEGLGFGVLGALISVFCAGAFQPWLSHGTALLLGVAIAVLGPIGDLFESLIKRDADAKDAGRMFGAHGGALDRLDAISFTVVAAYYIAVALVH